MNTAKDIKPQSVAKRTTATIANPGITYNQTGVTYNQIGLVYGGFSGASDSFSFNAIAKDIRP